MSTELNNDYAQPFDALTDILSHVVVGNKNLVVSDGSGNLKPGFKSPMEMGPVQAERIFPSFFCIFDKFPKWSTPMILQKKSSYKTNKRKILVQIAQNPHFG